MDPREIQVLNQRAPIRFNPGAVFNQNLPANASGYEIYLSGYADAVLKSIVSHSDKMALSRALTSLASNPRPIDGGFTKKGTVDTRAVKSGSISTNRYKIEYRILSGQVTVMDIELLDKFQEALNKSEKPGLYVVKKSAEGFWKIGVKPSTVNTITTKYAALNGQSNNRETAAWLMGRHLDYQYGRSDRIAEFTLFHNPSVGGLGDTWESMRDKFGFTTDVTKQFSQVLQEAQKKGEPVKWVAHSQGGLIFAEAVRYYLNGNSSWAIFGGFNGAFGRNEGKSLDVHSVAFHGSANNRMRSSVLFDRAKVKVVDYLAHPYDMVHQIIGLNTLNPRKLLGSVVYAPLVFNGSTDESPHSGPFKGMENWNKATGRTPGHGGNIAQNAFSAVEPGMKRVEAAVGSVVKAVLPNNLR